MTEKYQWWFIAVESGTIIALIVALAKTMGQVNQAIKTIDAKMETIQYLSKILEQAQAMLRQYQAARQDQAASNIRKPDHQ